MLAEKPYHHARAHVTSAVNLCLRMTSFLTGEAMLAIASLARIPNSQRADNQRALLRLVEQRSRDAIPPTTNNKWHLPSNDPKVTDSTELFQF